MYNNEVFTLHISDKRTINRPDISSCLLFYFIDILLNLEEGLVDIIKNFVYSKNIIQCKLRYKKITDSYTHFYMYNYHVNYFDVNHYIFYNVFTSLEDIKNITLKQDITKYSNNINSSILTQDIIKTTTWKPVEISIPNTQIKYWIILGFIEIENDDGLVLLELEPEVFNISIIEDGRLAGDKIGIHSLQIN